MCSSPATEGLPTRLIVAAGKGESQAVAAWLHEGGGVDAGCAECDDGTLLMGAASGGQEAIVRMLLQRGASVNTQGSSGVTALMYAAIFGRTTIVQTLLDAKAETTLRDSDGKTALMWAERCKHIAAAKILRQHAERQMVEAKTRAAASATHAAAAAGAMMDELLAEDAAEKEATAKKGKGKKKKDKAAPSVVASEPMIAAAPLASTPRSAAAEEGPPADVSDAEGRKHTPTAQLLRQHSKRQAAEAEAAVMHAAATAPTPNLSGRRVRIFSLKPKP